MRYPNTSAALTLGLSFVVALSVPAGARQSGSAGTTKTMECSQDTTRIDGVGERVRLTGECPTVVVSGSGNRVLVERVGSLNVSGMDNQVRWERSLQGDAPRVVSSGIKNTVTRVTPAADASPAATAAPPEKPRKSSPPPPPPPAPRATAPPSEGPVTNGGRLVVTQSGQTLRLDCASRQVTVSGSTNDITLTGTCGQVSVSGSGNKIAVERTPRIVATGHNNEIMWQYGAGEKQPSVRNSGMNNTVRRGDL